MNIIVQKFGGTSLQDPKLRDQAAKHVASAIQKGLSPIVVVSAMGRNKDPYATDTLITLATSEFEEMDLRERDMLIACGEVISSVMMVQTLKKHNVIAKSFNGTQAGILTDDNFSEANVTKVYPKNIIDALKEGIVPVITGFQGINEHGEITTFGRGGSDTTASVIAAAVKAKIIEIFSDVEGLLTADPKKVDKTHLISEASYTEAVEMANKGAVVIHPKAVQIAEKANIPIKLLATFNKDKSTIIYNMKSTKPVTGITSKKKILFVKIIPQSEDINETGLNIFKKLALVNVSVDFIDITPMMISFIIDDKQTKQLLEVLNNGTYNYSIDKNLAKISVVGSGMTGIPGVMAKIVNALNSGEIPIVECTDSYTTISCLVDEHNETKALNALHKEFDLGK